MSVYVPLPTDTRRCVCAAVESVVHAHAPSDRVACYVEQELGFSGPIHVPGDMELLVHDEYARIQKKQKRSQRFRVPLVIRHMKASVCGTRVPTAVAVGMPYDWPNGLAMCVCVHPSEYLCVHIVCELLPPDVCIPAFLTTHLRGVWSAKCDANNLRRSGVEVMEDRVQCVSDLSELLGDRHSLTNTQISYFGLFDGHHGNSAAEFLKQNLHKAIAASPFLPECLRHHPDAVSAEVNGLYESLLADAFEAVDEELKTHLPIDPVSLWTSGSTGCVVLLRGTTLHVANVGDGRCIVSRGGMPFQVTADHRVPTNEAEVRRLRRCGVNVTDHSNGDGYLNGMLQVSRAFGNFNANRMKLEGLIVTPDVFHLKLERSDEFMFMGCDGVFDKTRNTTINSKLRNFVASIETRREMGRELPVEEAPRETDTPAQRLVDFFRRHHEAIDNISVIVLELHHVT